MSIVIGETLLALSNVSMNYVNGTEKQVKENAKFSDQLGTTEVNNIVNEIYDKFGIKVGVSNSRFECFIPGDVLYRINTDSALKNKVYAMLADYSSSEFQTTMQTLNPPVKKCTLIFDENGDVVATLEPDVEKESVGSSKEKSVSAILENNSYNGIISDFTYFVTPNFELQSVLLAPTLKRIISLDSFLISWI